MIKLKQKNLVSSLLLVVLLISTFTLAGNLLYVLANPQNIAYLEQGIYPSAASYTVWVVNTTYYAKDAFGYIPSWGISSNASYIIQSCIDNLTQNPSSAYRRGAIYVAHGNYSLDVPLTFYFGTQLIGENAILNVNDIDVFDLTYSPAGNGVTEAIIQGFHIYNSGSGIGTVLHGVSMQDCQFKNIQIHGDFERYIHSQNNQYGANKNTYQNIYIRDNTYNSSRINIYLENNVTSGAFEYNSLFINVVSWGGNPNFDIYGDRLTFIDCVAYGISGNQGDGWIIHGRRSNVLMNVQLEYLDNGIRLWNSTLETTILNPHAATVTTTIENLVDYYMLSVSVNLLDIRGILQMANYIRFTRRTHPNVTGWGSDETGYQWFCNTHNNMEHWNGANVIYWNATGTGIEP